MIPNKKCLEDLSGFDTEFLDPKMYRLLRKFYPKKEKIKKNIVNNNSKNLVFQNIRLEL